jgi:hypothetical protein
VAKQTIENKMMMGDRQLNDDGFTYPYGRVKTFKSSRSESIKRQIRNDKRSVKAKELTRIKKEF